MRFCRHTRPAFTLLFSMFVVVSCHEEAPRTSTGAREAGGIEETAVESTSGSGPDESVVNGSGSGITANPESAKEEGAPEPVERQLTVEALHALRLVRKETEGLEGLERENQRLDEFIALVQESLNAPSSSDSYTPVGDAYLSDVPPTALSQLHAAEDARNAAAEWSKSEIDRILEIMRHSSPPGYGGFQDDLSAIRSALESGGQSIDWHPVMHLFE